jgi:hypothetical protein
MTELGVYVGMGFRHITAIGALDHLLFLVALVAPYRLHDWRQLVIVATAFTIGHSITLALAVTNVVRLPTALIEFLIPLTIVAAAVGNLRQASAPRFGRHRALLAGGFGLIHGAGFANFLRTMFFGPIAVPLVSFNIGIELGQLVIIVAMLLVFSVADPFVAVRRRAVLASVVVAVWAVTMAAQRVPW